MAEVCTYGAGRMARRPPRHVAGPLFGAALLLLLSGCMLMSGEVSSADRQERGGNLVTRFVSAEGQSERRFKVADGPVSVQVIAIVAVESGDLRIDLLQPDGAVVFSVEGRPDNEVTRSGQVQTDDQGQVRFRVVTRGARNGSYQLFFQR